MPPVTPTPDANQITAPQAVNYQALRQPIHGPASWRNAAYVGFGLAGLAAMARATVGQGSQAIHMGSTALLTVGIVLGIGSLTYFAILRGRLVDANFQQFLAENNWHSGLNQTDDVATSLLGIGHDQKVTESFTGQYRGLPFTVVNYQYTTGSGKNQQTTTLIDMHIHLSQQFPLIVLDDSKNNLWFISNLPERIPGSKKLQVEGNFNQRFALSVMPGTEQTVLQLLTPDFMAELLDNQQAADVELAANSLFMIAPGMDFREELLARLFATADVVLKHLSELSDSWQASSSPEMVQQMAAQALAPRERKISGRNPTWTIASFLIVAVYCGIMLLGTQFANTKYYVLFFAAFFLFGAIMFVRSLMRR